MEAVFGRLVKSTSLWLTGLGQAGRGVSDATHWRYLDLQVESTPRCANVVSESAQGNVKQVQVVDKNDCTQHKPI